MVSLAWRITVIWNFQLSVNILLWHWNDTIQSQIKAIHKKKGKYKVNLEEKKAFRWPEITEYKKSKWILQPQKLNIISFHFHIHLCTQFLRKERNRWFGAAFNYFILISRWKGNYNDLIVPNCKSNTSEVLLFNQ